MDTWVISNSSNSGSDWIDYSYITDTTAINADLSKDDGDSTTNNEREVVQIGNNTNFDSLEGILNVRGTKNADILKGDDDFNSVNTLDGYSGDDTIYGSFGADVIIGGTHGARGDTVNYSNMYRIAITALASTSYVFAIDGINISFTSDGTGNQADILAGLVADFNAKAGDKGTISTDGTNIYVSTFESINTADANMVLDGRVKVDLNGNADEDGAKDTAGADVVDTLNGIENAVGTIGDDEIYGNSSKNTLQGGAGNDTIEGNQGDDYIDGEAGDDILKGGTGRDTIYGGAGDDSIYGNENDDKLYGGTGNDTFITGSGNDSVTGGDGIDLLTFTTENDYKIVANLMDGTSNAYGEIVVNGETNYLRDHVEIIRGSTYGDTISGYNESTITHSGADFQDTIDGSSGNDTISGGIEDDILIGGDGNDTLSGQAGDDKIYGGTVDDIYNITSHNASGADFASYEDSTNGVIVYLDNKDATGVDVAHTTMNDGFGTTDDLYNITGVIGSTNNDILKGDRGHNTLIGGTGSDTIIASDGGDYIYGGIDGGADIHDPTDAIGNNGGDWLSFEAIGVLQATNDGTNTNLNFDRDDVILNNDNDATNGLDDTYYKAVIDMSGVDLSAEDFTDTNRWAEYNVGVTANMIGGSVTGGLGVTSIFQIEHLKGTTYRDTLGGDSANNSLDGFTGDDLLYGHGGNDYLAGGDGDDTLRGGSGSDQYDGGAGEDILDFNYPTGLSGAAEHRVWVDLSRADSDADATTTGVVIDDGYGVEVTDANNIAEQGIKGIENLGGTENYGDTLIGNDSANKIYGYGGSDLLDGKGGIDEIYGGTGVDTLVGGAGNDTLYGGEDSDVFYGGTGVDYIDGGSTGSDAVAFDNTWGEAAFNGDLDRDNDGFADSDGTTVINTIKVNLTTQQVENDGYGNVDTLISIDRVLGSDQGDILIGSNSGYDGLYGYGGDDTIHLSTNGNDILDGGDNGTYGDWLSLEYAYRGTIDLAGSDGGTAVTASNFENILGRSSVARGETVWGTTGNNIFIMYDGNDYILGRSGNDIYDLGAGNDRAAAGSGSDTIIGGAGTDILDYRNHYTGSSVSIILQDISFDTNDDGVNDTTVTSRTVQQTLSLDLDTLNAGTHDFFEITDSRGATDYIYKQADGTSDFETFYLSTIADVMVSDDNANRIYAYEGNDTVLGMGGDDYIAGDEGADLLYGGDGADHLLGGSGNDRLYGGDGADDIDGGSNIDTIKGGLGDDNLSGDSGDDTIYNEAGTDVIDGGTDRDLLIFEDNGLGIKVDLTGNIFSGTVGNAVDSYGNEETVTGIEDVQGTAQNDVMIGNDVDNTFWALGGDDTFSVSLGNDFIYAGDGEEDTIDFTSINGLITALNTNGFHNTVDLNGTHKADFDTGVKNSTNMYNVENVIGTSLTDYIKGEDIVAYGNTIYGNAGDDSLEGLAGDDYLVGGADSDHIEGGAGDDTLFGDNIDGTGVSSEDWVVYDNSLSGIKINLDTISHDGINANTATGEGTDTLNGFEHIIGSSSSDTLYGNAQNNSILAGAGEDTLYGLAGNDNLYGNGGIDTIDGGDGADNMYGGGSNDIFISNAGTDLFNGQSGSDTIDYSAIDSSLNVTLNENGVDTTITINGTDTLQYIENIVGSNTQADSIVGNSESNTLQGMAGADTLKGGAGADYLVGGSGDDRLFAGVDNDNDYIEGSDDGQTNGDWVDYSAHTTTINIDLTTNRATGAGTDTIVGIENIELGSGDDIAHGNVYANSFIGGSGNDTLTYANASNSVIIDFDNGTVTGDGSDNFTQFENFIGSTKADILYNDSVKADSLFATYDAGANGSGFDIVDYTASSQNIEVNVNGSTITLTVGANDDILSNVEILKTGTGDDVYTLDNITGIDTLDAGAGTDSLSVTGDLDLSSITLLNFEEILAQDGQIVTIDATDIDNQTMTLHTQGTGQIIVNATADISDHDFNNITVQNDATGKITLNVDNSIDLSSKNIEGLSGNIFDEYDVANGAALTLDATQIDGETTVLLGAGDLIIQATTTQGDHDFASLTNSGSGDITLDVNSTIDLKAQNLGAINRYDVAASQTLTLLNTQLTGAMIIAGAGAIELNSATPNSNIDLTSLVDDNFTGTLVVNDGVANNTIVSNNENTQINLTSGNDTVTLGNGINTVNIDALNITNNDTITATAGSNDTLNITSTGTSDLSGVSGVETVNLSNNGANTVTVGTNSATINGANNADTFKFAIGNLSNADVVNGNGGIDVLEFTDAGNITASQLTNIDVETINLANGLNNITVGTKDYIINGGSGADTFNYTVSDLSSSDDITGNAGTDTLNLTDAGTITATMLSNIDVENINLSNGVNNITVGTTNYNVTGGSGNDTFNYAIADLTNADTIDGVSGDDTIVFTDAGTIDNSKFDNVSNIDTIQFANGANTVTVDQNGVNLIGGAGSDTFNYAKADFSSADNIDAGNGTDTLTITDNGGTYTDADFTNLSNFETLNLSDSGADTITLGSIQIQNAGFETINTRGGADTVTLTDTTGLTSIDGGANSDELIISTANMNYSSLNISNFETITVNENTDLSGKIDSVVSTLAIGAGKTLTIDASDFDGETINITGTGDVIITATNTASDHTFTNITNSGSGNITLDVNATVNLSAQSLGDVNIIDIANGSDITLDGSQLDGKTITLNTSGDVIVNNINGADLSNITFTGNGALTLNVANGATLDASSLDVSSYGGVVTINDSSGAETITATNDTNIINVSGGADVIHGGTGTDTLNINTTNTLSSIDGIENINVNANNDLSGKLDGTVTDITLANGITLNAQSSDVSGKNITDGSDIANLNVTANADVNLSNTNIGGTLTINDDTGSHNITGSSNNDILELNSGNDVVDLGEGSDIINTDIANLDINDDISDTGLAGTDAVTFNDSGNIDSADVIDFSGIETLNMHSGDDTVTFDDVSEFNNFRNELDVVDSGGTDTLKFGTTSVDDGSGGTIDLDFTNLDEFENLELSSSDDNITLSGDEPDNVYGLNGNDNFTLDYSNVSSFNNIDGGAGIDEVELQGVFAANNTLFGTTGDYDHIETLDISSMSLTGTDSDEVQFTGDLINEWTNNGSNNGSLKLQLSADQMENIGYTDSGSTYHNSVSDGMTYTLESGAQLTIEQVS